MRHPKNGEQNPSMIPETPGYTRARRLLSLSSVVRDALPVMRAAVANTAVLRIAINWFVAESAGGRLPGLRSKRQSV